MGKHTRPAQAMRPDFRKSAPGTGKERKRVIFLLNTFCRLAKDSFCGEVTT
jgi:hypothetical protein